MERFLYRSGRSRRGRRRGCRGRRPFFQRRFRRLHPHLLLEILQKRQQVGVGILDDPQQVYHISHIVLNVHLQDHIDEKLLDLFIGTGIFPRRNVDIFHLLAVFADQYIVLIQHKIVVVQKPVAAVFKRLQHVHQPFCKILPFHFFGQVCQSHAFLQFIPQLQFSIDLHSPHRQQEIWAVPPDYLQSDVIQVSPRRQIQFRIAFIRNHHIRQHCLSPFLTAVYLVWL